MTAWLRSGARVVEVPRIAERAARAGYGFASLGIGAGDAVAVCLRNDFAFLEASVAAGLVGAYLTPVNWHNSADEARYVFENSGAKAIVIHSDLHAGIAHALPAGVPVFVVETPPEIVSATGSRPTPPACPRARPVGANGFPGFRRGRRDRPSRPAR